MVEYYINFLLLCFWKVNWKWVILQYTYPIFLKVYIANSMTFSEKTPKIAEKIELKKNTSFLYIVQVGCLIFFFSYFLATKFS
jgi:hypothetical protein